MNGLELQPISQEEAFEFIDEHHSTHDRPNGWKYGMAVNDGEKVVGVAVVERPSSRHYDDGWTLEVSRCCTDGTPNVASKLYAACWRVAKNLGYKRLITYTITETEDGTCLNAAGWEVIHSKAGGGSWNREKRPRVDSHPTAQKTLWEVNGNDPSEAIADGGITEGEDGRTQGGEAGE